MENSQCLLKGWKTARVHRGFLEAYRAMSEDLLSRIEQLLIERRRPVLLTGNSLGGALATVCSFDLLLGGLPITSSHITVCTFGASKWGNLSWCKMYSKLVPSH